MLMTISYWVQQNPKKSKTKCMAYLHNKRSLKEAMLASPRETHKYLISNTSIMVYLQTRINLTFAYVSFVSYIRV